MKKWLVCIICLFLLPGCALADGEIDWSRPVVALTFDDGPSEYTPLIVQLLEENGGHATFFMLGNRINTYKEAALAVAASGSEIGTHTFSHERLPDTSRGSILRSLTNSIQVTEEVTGRKVKYLRPPYGAVGDAAYQVCRQLNMPIIIWSLSSRDWEGKSAEEISETILTKVQNGDIILCHDTLKNTYEAMKTVIPELVERGYQLVTISEMFSAYDEELKINALYSHLDFSKVNVHK